MVIEFWTITSKNNEEGTEDMRQVINCEKSWGWWVGDLDMGQRIFIGE